MFLHYFYLICYLRRLEESEKKRQAMMQAMKDQANKAKGPNFTITKKDLAGVGGIEYFFSFNYLQ